MFDQYVMIMTSDFSDPYKELEWYLEQAQEEIGRAVKELEHHEKNPKLNFSDILSWDHSSSTQPVPPESFHSSDGTGGQTTRDHSPAVLTVNRVCHDGNIFDVQKHVDRIFPNSTGPSFSASLSPGSLGTCRRQSLSPETRRRLWQMHPSVSFPETVNDLLSLRTNPALECASPGANEHSKSSTLPLLHSEFRRRSSSDSSVSRVLEPKRIFTIPAPPSENVNLLSLWANNLVSELDRNFSGDALDSGVASTSRTPNTLVDEVDASAVSASGMRLKAVSLSPDSGIGQVSYEALDAIEESDHSKCSFGSEYLCACDNLITPPPPEFDDGNFEEDMPEWKYLARPSDRAVSNGHAKMCAAVSVFEAQETSADLQDCLRPLPRVIAPRTVELEESSVSGTTCILNDGPYRTLPNSPTSKCHSQSLGRDCKSSSLYSRAGVSSPGKGDAWSCTLPREFKSCLDPPTFHRSVSHSAVLAKSPVDIIELSALVRQMKEVPSCVDVATNANVNQDAVTQTTPVALSRSSSLTWVTECDCSDWELNNMYSGSDDGIVARTSSSSSSFELSSEDDDDNCITATPGSSSGSSSSLYLSACSGSSDSFEEAEPANRITQGDSPEWDDVGRPTTLRTSSKMLSSLENSSSALGDIQENEMAMIDALSLKSAPSNPSLASEDPFHDQPASFPSTLKTSKLSSSTGQPTGPASALVKDEWNLKSISAPVLLRQKRQLSGPRTSHQSRMHKSSHDGGQVPARSQSAKELNELQAIEACNWLRAAGFPQYAQMYEDNQFPIDVSLVQKDHPFLPPDSIQSLFRRLNTLNRCANMKYVDHAPRKSLHMEDSDEEEQYALSENWEFQRASRQWSRIIPMSDGMDEFVPPDLKESAKPSNSDSEMSGRKYLNAEEAYCSSHDSVLTDEQFSSPDNLPALKPDNLFLCPSPGSSSGSGGTLSLASDDVSERRTLSGTKRVKEGAKALLKRVESLKGSRKKKRAAAAQNSIPYRTDKSSSRSLTSSPQSHRSQKLSHSANLHADLQKLYSAYSTNDDGAAAHSDSECLPNSSSSKDAGSGDKKHCKEFKTSSAIVVTSASATFPQKSNYSSDSKYSIQTGLLQPSSGVSRDSNSDCDKRSSYYDNISTPIVVYNDFFSKSLDRNLGHTHGSEKLNSQTRSLKRENEEVGLSSERRDSGVGSSLSRGMMCIINPAWHCFPPHVVSEMSSSLCSMPITELTAPQMLVLRKLSLLKLTAVMERFSPSSKTGWSWAVPKFIRRIRNPDYKDKNVFGVPLLLVLQRTGQPLPSSIQAAIHYLQDTCLDSTGLFRKSGVRSRIQKLKGMSESNSDQLSYEEQQAYDVADMLKQYFRELPEVLLTNKLSETFISIFQFVPEDLLHDAIQAAIMLMPDENREVLQSLLQFLSEVCKHSGVNQMTSTNLAVCFAPSLFHLSSSRSASSSPRRRKTVGVPDPRELNENRAACECLSYMISNYETLFFVTKEMFAPNRISSSTFSQAATLEEISSFVYDGQVGLKGYIDSCIQMFLKEAKEKYKSFENFSLYENVEISYKKLSDGHPLRLWKVSTEIEAPPSVVLSKILRERHLWDPSFSKSKMIARPVNNTEVYQYMCLSLPPHPHCDYCVLRSWRTDLPRGACILIETSVNHPDAEVNPDSVRALILASRYLIEPCGSGKSRITHLSRVDTRGRSPEWYNRAYGHICALLLIKLRNSFPHVCTDGPETKL